MAVEAIDWLAPPALTNATDSTNYAMGCSFTVDESVACPGLRWRVPDAIVPAPPGGYWGSLYQDGVGRIKHVALSPVAGGEQDFAWDSPVTLSPGNTYTVQVHTQRYVFTGSSSYPYATPSGVGEASTGRLSATNDPDVEATGNAATSRFYVSPLLGEDDPGEDVTASFAWTLPALAAAFTGKTEVTASFAWALPALDAQLSVDAPITASLALTLPALDAALSVDVDGDDAAMGMVAVMDEIAAVLRTVTPRFKTVHPLPPAGAPPAPAGVVTFPERVVYDETYRPASVERYERIAVFALCGQPNLAEKTVRNRMGGWLTGTGSIKVLLETHDWQSCEVLSVSEAEIGSVTIAGVEYLAAMLYMDAAGIGA